MKKTKKKYTVDVCRIGYSFATIEVEANSVKEAKEKAYEEAGDREFSENSSDYKIDTVIETSKLK